MLVPLVAVLALGALASAASAKPLEWQKNGAALTKTEEISLKGGRQTLSAAGKNIQCEEIQGTGDVQPGAGGKGEVTLHLSKCTTEKTGCQVHSAGEPNGTITMANIATDLIIAETTKGVKLIAQELKENPKTKEFTTLDFEGATETSCSFFGKSAKMKGSVGAEISNTTESYFFPSPELEGNTLEMFGLAALWDGEQIKQELTGGGKLTAVEV
jgi:hypothetical protein